MEKCTHLDVGATLFVPANHKSLFDVVSHRKYPKLKSVVIDLEDGLDKEDLNRSLILLENFLKDYEKRDLLVFVRPKDVLVLQKLLELQNISRIDGFVLAKFSLENARCYLDLLQKGDFLFMPSIEGKELFSYDKLEKLRELLFPYRANIPLVRYGLEDMLRQLSMKRSCNETIFDYAVGSFVLGQFIAVFKSVGFKISGGVYPCFKDTDGFIRDVQRDLKEGLFGKTIIHPHQIELCDELYKVTKKQYLESLEILKSEKSVFSQNGKMVETKTMSLFAQEIVKRAEVYGLVEDKV